MAEPIEHTCTVAYNWGRELKQCAETCSGCRAEFLELCEKEARVLDAVYKYVVAYEAGNYTAHAADSAKVFAAGKEYVETRRRVLNANKGDL